jgi:hypothetical protein
MEHSENPIIKITYTQKKSTPALTIGYETWILGSNSGGYEELHLLRNKSRVVR